MPVTSLDRLHSAIPCMLQMIITAGEENVMIEHPWAIPVKSCKGTWMDGPAAHLYDVVMDFSDKWVGNKKGFIDFGGKEKN